VTEVALPLDRFRRPYCPLCGHVAEAVCRGLCLSMIDGGATDIACGCRAIGPDGKLYLSWFQRQWIYLRTLFGK
jgi:hypothetical protein